MRSSFYMDIYSLPSVDYQDEIIKQGHPVSIDEYNGFVEKIYNIFRKKIDNTTNNGYKSILKISNKHIVLNLANYLKYKYSMEYLKDYSIKYSTVKEFSKCAGTRNLSTDFLTKYMQGNTPFLDYWMRDFFHNNYKEFIKNILTKIQIYNKEIAIYNPNNWMINYLNDNRLKYNILYDQFFWPKDNPINTDIYKYTNIDLNQFSESVMEDIIFEFQISDNKTKRYIENLIKRVFYKIELDLSNAIKNVSKKKFKFKKILTGTAGSYKTAVIIESLKRFNITTASFMHSGSISHIKYDFDPRVFIEYSIPDEFYVFNNYDIAYLNMAKDKYKLDILFKPMRTTMKKDLSKNNVISKKDKIKKIAYISPALSGYMRFFGVADDIMSVSFEYNLFKTLNNIGDYEIRIKTHPKGVRRNDKLLIEKFKDIHIIDNETMTDTIKGDTDIFINRMIDSTAFNEIVASNKPMILINDTGTEHLTNEAKEALKHRVAFVDCHYENGLAVINEKQLKEALNREYIMDFEFVNRFQ